VSIGAGRCLGDWEVVTRLVGARFAFQSLALVDTLYGTDDVAAVQQLADWVQCGHDDVLGVADRVAVVAFPSMDASLFSPASFLFFSPPKSRPGSRPRSRRTATRTSRTSSSRSTRPT